MSSSQRQHKDEGQSEAATCEATLALTQDFSRPVSLARVAQPSTLTSKLGIPLLYLRAGTLSAKLLLSGGVAGAISRTATAPIDRLKFLLQVQDNQLITIRQVHHQHGIRNWHSTAVSGLMRAHRLCYTDIHLFHETAAPLLQGFRLMAAEGTYKAYFRGNGANVIKNVPETALKLTFNDRVKAMIASDGHTVSLGGTTALLHLGTSLGQHT